MVRNVVLAGLLLTSAPALANDSEAALGLGGLLFEHNAQIAMESEDLFLSAEKVDVRYTYRNTSTRPLTILVAFPLPDVPLEGQDWDWMEASYPDWDDIGMVTRVQGQEVQLMRIDIPKVAGKDVSARLKAEGWPVRFWQDAGLDARLNALSADDKSALVAEGLLTREGMEGQDVRPAWSVSTSFVRTQTFPPGVAVTVQHSYTPRLGGSVASALDRDAREESMPGRGGYTSTYCVDQAFLRGYDRKRYKPDGGRNHLVYPVETWLNYTLSTGANWKGPIKRFRLTVDKGSPDALLSLCMDGIRKISPTRFEVVKTDFEPDRDLELLIVRMIPTEGGQ